VAPALQNASAMNPSEQTPDLLAVAAPTKLARQKRESIAQTLALSLENGALLRSAARAQLKADVDFSSDSNFYGGFSTDIADGGLFVATLSLLEVGSHVAVKFTMPSGEEVEAQGEVRWVRSFDERAPYMFPGMGIKFTQLSPRAKTQIASFVAQREPMFFPE
jgi:uncharacterized protein (TIGR02266 family)